MKGGEEACELQPQEEVCTCILGRLFPAPAAGAQGPLCGLLAADLFPVLWTKPSSTPQLPKPRRTMNGRGVTRLPGLHREVTV